MIEFNGNSGTFISFSVTTGQAPAAAWSIESKEASALHPPVPGPHSAVADFWKHSVPARPAGAMPAPDQRLEAPHSGWSQSSNAVGQQSPHQPVGAQFPGTHDASLPHGAPPPRR